MKSIFLKATVIAALCAMAVAAVLSVMSYRSQVRLALHSLTERGAMLTDLTGHEVGGSVHFGKVDAAKAIMFPLIDISKNEVTEGLLLTLEGDLFYHLEPVDGPSQQEAMTAIGKRSLEMIRKAQAENRHMSNAEELLISEDGLIFAHPAYFGSDAQMVGAIVMRVSDKIVLADIQSETRRILVLAGITFLVALAAAAFLLRQMISRPLGKLNLAVAEVAAGNYAVEVPSRKARDEIGTIARALEGFRSNLSASVATTREAMFKGSGFQGASASLVITDPEFTILYVNGAANRLLEAHFPAIASGQIQGKSALSFDPGLQSLAQAVRVGLPQRTSLAIGTRSLDVLTDAVRDGAGTLTGYILEWQSTTELRRNATVLTTIDAGQVRAELSPQGVVDTANPRLAALLDSTATSLKGRDLSALITPVDPAEGDLWSSLRKGQAVQGLMRLALPSGSGAIIDAHFSPIRDDQGTIRSLLLLGTDVTQNQTALAAADQRRREMEAAQARVVENLRSALSRLSDGDLTCAITDSFSEDYERLRLDFNEAANRLRAAMSDVVTSSVEIRNEVSEISSAAENLSRRTEQQAATLEQTAAALDQMTTSVKSTAEVATHANAKVDEAKRSAETSGRVVGEAVAAMSEIEQSSSKISRITSVIDEIAFQTNLLALNAGVEAARAGEAGRGFAVVASEVRDLAQRSSEAAREIAGLITASSDQVKRGVNLVAEAGRSLTGIQTAVGEIHGLVTDIANAAREQSNGIAELNTAVKHLDQVTQQNAAMFEETTAASQSLNRSATTLSGTTQHFQIGQAPRMDSPRKPSPAKPPLATSPTARSWGTPAAGAPKVNFQSSRKPQAAPKAETKGNLAMQPEASEGWEEF
jgi:methyl-accepting chemotaxis protein